MPGAGDEAAVKTGSSQWPEITMIALGRSGRLETMLLSQASVLFQASFGSPMMDQSMKKHGPPPCGMNKVGCLASDGAAIFSPRG